MTKEWEPADERMAKDALAGHLGINLVEIKTGYARGELQVRPELLNGLGITHGGAVFSLADVVFAAASNSHGPAAVALDVHISFIKATGAGDKLVAEAFEENLTKKTGLYRMEVRDGSGELVAVAQGLVYRKN